MTIDLSNWGNRYKGVMPPGLGDVHAVLDNQAIAERPEPVAVHLFRPNRTVPGFGENADAHAKITYSTGSAANTFRCDWDGQFSLVCNAITIELETYAPLADDLQPYQASATRQVTFGASIGLGACPSGGSEAIAYTAGGVLVGGGSTVNIPVPLFARRYYPVLCKNPDSGGQAVEQADLADLSIAYFNEVNTRLVVLPLTMEILTHGLVLPGGLALISFGNTGVLSSFHCMHHFKLGL